MKKRLETADYYLGKLVGEIIFLRYLPTLNVDSLQSLHVINVSEEEKAEADRLHIILNETYYGYDITEEISKYVVRKPTERDNKNWRDYVHKLEEKYLPEKIHCRFERIDVVNKHEFKEGIVEYLWNTDLSCYMPEDDFWVTTTPHSWFSEVIITRKIGS